MNKGFQLTLLSGLASFSLILAMFSSLNVFGWRCFYSEVVFFFLFFLVFFLLRFFLMLVFLLPRLLLASATSDDSGGQYDYES